MIPPTFTEETRREFEEKFKNRRDMRGYNFLGVQMLRDMKSFLLSRTTAAYDLRTKEVREIVEEMLGELKHSKDCSNAPWVGGSGECDVFCQVMQITKALSDLLTRLTK